MKEIWIIQMVINLTVFVGMAYIFLILHYKYKIQKEINLEILRIIEQLKDIMKTIK